MLVMWETNETTTSIDYLGTFSSFVIHFWVDWLLGVRVLPLILNLDGEALANYSDFFSLLDSNIHEEVREDDMSQPSKRFVCFFLIQLISLSVAHYRQLTSIPPEVILEEDQTLTFHIQKLHIFPIEIKLSIGRNNLFLPVLYVPIP